jgi:hypothetical protein
MKTTRTCAIAGALALGIFCAYTILGPAHPIRAEEAADARKPVDVAALKAEVERLKGLVPDQAHAMADVDFHAANLWFAGKAGNWDLAQFYMGEVRSHLKWAVRIIPVRKNPKGGEVFLEQLLAAVDAAQLEPVKKAIVAKDAALFEKTYTEMLNGCYMCHVASGKPYLRLHIPETPGAHMIDFSLPK